ncbi:hypothetical protein HPB50_002698 [Hyalomma asiaticum]|uniref:Uncharacterized protein n=1 Tax=Hyalomma asiaticum TaxID=266040 RepID=A0ACB7TBY4_HYAAI|nr:hypothetical protein HPB50_002698 [Hyalomma asiaticum]
MKAALLVASQWPNRVVARQWVLLGVSSLRSRLSLRDSRDGRGTAATVWESGPPKQWPPRLRLLGRRMVCAVTRTTVSPIEESAVETPQKANEPA